MDHLVRGRTEDVRKRLHEADIRVNGSLSDRLERERERLLEKENEYKERLSAIAGFRKAEIIPIGKLQTALDESDSESEQISDSEETTGARETRNDAVQESGQLDNSLDWNHPQEMSQPVDASLSAPEDLDADVEDLDGDGEEYSHSLEPEEGSESRFEESYQPIEPSGR